MKGKPKGWSLGWTKTTPRIPMYTSPKGQVAVETSDLFRTVEFKRTMEGVKRIREMNQCDGCRRQLPLREAFWSGSPIHYDKGHDGQDYPYMACTAKMYQVSETSGT